MMLPRRYKREYLYNCAATTAVEIAQDRAATRCWCNVHYTLWRLLLSSC